VIRERLGIDGGAENVGNRKCEKGKCSTRSQGSMHEK